MTGWKRALDTAGVADPRLREDYTEQRRLVSQFRRGPYLAARLLLPPPLLPHVIAATAFMHHTDTILDADRPRAERVTAYEGWEKQVRLGLATSEGDRPLIRALLHTVSAHPALQRQLESYLATAPTDLDASGFATEAAYQHYIDAYSLPAFMLIACLVGPADDPAYRSACRSYIDAAQRLDNLKDLSADLRGGRFTIPTEILEHHGVVRADLEGARDTPGTRALVQDLLERARRSLEAGRTLVDLTPPANRPLVRSLISLEELTLEAAATKGVAVLGRSTRASVPAAAVLIREYRQARRLR
ncbi:squalene/phytoene synthase family protein [Actinoallomurus sp. NPDC052274]|uniref:phytoene/squalene synthase family protein n=1 Tax=Actinoallomurus sp. NPDC052274 TaxID=3155420 RepID=UPI0034484434